MWKPEHRCVAERHGLDSRSDLTDAEWALVEPTIPPAKHGGPPRDVNVREASNAIFYVLSTAATGRLRRKDLPPRGTLFSLHALGLGRHAGSTFTTRSTWRRATGKR